MNANVRSGHPPDDARPHTLSEPAIRSASAWVAQLARTLKTCRLYDAANPAVIRFRDELAQATEHLVEEHGSLTFAFTANDVLCDGRSTYPARSREDNLAYPFHRDGVRSITLNPGIDRVEVATLLDIVLAVTGTHLDDGDLVTLFWEADLRHIDADFIPAEGDTGGPTGPEPADGQGALIPWPAAQDEDEKPAEDAKPDPDAKGRSEDWSLGELTVEVEASYVELDAIAPAETERFRREFADEHAIGAEAAALAIATACLNAGAQPDDQREISGFMPRVLRGAVASGAWEEARAALETLRELRTPLWSEETFVQELLQPVSVVRVVEQLDLQEPAAVGAFLQLAKAVGDAGIDWLTLTLCESQSRTTRTVLAEAIAQRCHDRPERLSPWLSDSRWYVVRNMAYILGWIGGPAIVPLLQVAIRHEDARVRAQVVASLAQVELRHSRPLLVRALDGADTRLFCQVLAQLSGARDPATARYLVAYVQQERFATRPPEERRALYAAIASVGGDEIVPDLERELSRGNWFDRSLEIHRHNVARCLARIGTAHARSVLEEAARSRRAPVRQAAAAALGAMREAA